MVARGIVVLKKYFIGSLFGFVRKSSCFEKNSEKLYEDHIITNDFQKSFMAIGSAFRAFFDPRQVEAVATFGEVTGKRALQRMFVDMNSTEEGRQIFRDKPTINTTILNFEELIKMPNETLGHEYANFMLKNNITSNDRTKVKFIDDSDLAFVMHRYRQIHDFFHLLTGFTKISVPSELAVKLFEGIQTDLPLCLLGSTLGSLTPTISWKSRYDLLTHVVPWALYAAPRSKPFISVYFEKRLDQKLTDLRMELNVIPYSNI